MKKVLLSSLVACLPFLYSCDKKNEPIPEDSCFRVKVVAEKCADVVLQIQDESKFHLGVNGYVHEGKTYDHVFLTYPSCKDARKMPLGPMANKDSIFFVKIVPTPASDSTCGWCAAALGNTPNKFHYVSVTNGCNNDD